MASAVDLEGYCQHRISLRTSVLELLRGWLSAGAPPWRTSASVSSIKTTAPHPSQPRVVVGFDGSGGSKDALVFARVLTAMTGSILETVCVYLYSPWRRRLASGDLARAAVARSQQWTSALQPLQQTIVPAVSVADGLSQVAGATAAQFVVVGSRRSWTPFARAPARDLLRRLPPFAVVVVPVGFALRASPSLHRIAAVDDRSAADGLALLLAQRLAEATCCDLESLSHSEAARLHRATGRIGRCRRTIHSCPCSLLDSAADLVVVADSGHTSLRRVRPAAFRILLRGCPVPVLFVSRGLEAHSFMAHAARTEAATHEKADGPGD